MGKTRSFNMGLLDDLQNVIQQGMGQGNGRVAANNNNTYGESGPGASAGGGSGVFDQILKGMGGKGGILGSSALGGLIGAITGGKALHGALGGALLAGGVRLWNRYRQRVQEESEAKAGPTYGSAPAPADERAARIIRALVYAAKADGHIDEQEKSAISRQVAQLRLGPEGERLVRQAMDEPLEPENIAQGVKTPDEALEIFTLSLAVLNVDNFMERSYLDGLAKALNIPEDVKSDMLAKSTGQA